MKIELKIPTTKGKRNAFFMVVAVFLVFFAELMEFAVRSESDLKNPKTYCGELDKYYFDDTQIRGFSTWRVDIKNKNFERRVFRVGDKYILSSNALSAEDKGARICLEFIRYIIPGGAPFISQIYINGIQRLNPIRVRDEYLSSFTSFDRYMIIIFFMIGFVLLIHVKRS